MFFPDISTLKSKRQKLGLTQKTLAERTRVSQSFIAKLEQGVIDSSYQTTVRIFLALEAQEHAQERRCSEIMKSPIISVSSRDLIEKASRLMKKHSISQLPVFEGTKQVGSITESRMVNTLIEEPSKEKFLKNPG